MIPKTEPSENIPKSSPPMSLDSIIKDLKGLETSLISDKQRAENQLKIMDSKVKMLELENARSTTHLNDMKSKMRLLEEQNSKLKSDLEATESEKILYHGQYQKIGTKLDVLQKENGTLKAKYIELLEAKFIKLSKEAKSPVSSKSNEAKEFEAANRVSDLYASGKLFLDNHDSDVTNFGAVVDDAPEWTRSKLTNNDETTSEGSIRGSSKNMTSPIPKTLNLSLISRRENTDAMDRQLALKLHRELNNEWKSSRQNKRKAGSESLNKDFPISKKRCFETVDPSWNCNICFGLFKFASKAGLHEHVKETHPTRTWFCERCPFTATKKSGLVKHEKLHVENEMKFKDTEKAGKCNLCNVWFPPGSALANHNKLYHIPTLDDYGGQNPNPWKGPSIKHCCSRIYTDPNHHYCIPLLNKP